METECAEAKPKVQRQARGRTATEMDDDDTGPRYCIRRRHVYHIEPCKCPSDGRLTYKRDTEYDCTMVPGTMTTYCFAFFKKANTVSVRQYSCYCRWCARSRYDKCASLAIVRHDTPKRCTAVIDVGVMKVGEMLSRP